MFCSTWKSKNMLLSMKHEELWRPVSCRCSCLGGAPRCRPPSSSPPSSSGRPVGSCVCSCPSPAPFAISIVIVRMEWVGEDCLSGEGFGPSKFRQCQIWYKWERGTLPQQFAATGKLGEIKRTKKGKIWKNCWKWGACSCGLIWKMGADGSSFRLSTS